MSVLKLRSAKTILLMAGLLLGASGPVAGQTLAPFKDRLFSYKRILETSRNGDFLVVEYSKQRDLHGRDKVPEREVFGNYVSYQPRRSRQGYDLQANGRTVNFMGVGKVRGGASASVIYVHGQGGNRFQGVNDVTFGGNFNRIQNLMVRNGGAYLSAEFSDFGARGTADVAALVQHQKMVSPNAKVVVACGSMGGIICWNLLKTPRYAAQIDGLILLGSPADPAVLNPSVLQRRIPIHMSYGSDDAVYDWRQKAGFFDQIRSIAPGYPIRFTLFDTGSHGTPIRMTDWRSVLNWMFSLH
ncbi:phospholipase [Roseibium aquae]|uniref:Phospholipase n=1 Tax=Roseibium aquae TaxID=1323746 RepID=A0A916X2E6_9HYPH|nr:alpha/beta hydrolase [Roseibium aquae]GGB49591.1 phospholipase [Roseibium aquae]